MKETCLGGGFRIVSKFWLPALILPVLLTGCGSQPIGPQTIYSSQKHQWQTTRMPSSHGTIVIAMATWCKYCAWEAKWQEPRLFQWAQTHKVRVLVINITKIPAIGIAGPLSAPASGQDGTHLLPHTTWQETLTQYAILYKIPSQFLYGDPNQTSYFSHHTKSLPTIFFISAQGHLDATKAGITPAGQIEKIALADHIGT